MGAVVSFRVVGNGDDRRAARLRAFVEASRAYERLHAARRIGTNLLAAGGIVLWLVLAGVFGSSRIVTLLALTCWPGLLGFTAVVGALELVWRRRREQAAAHLPQR